MGSESITATPDAGVILSQIGAALSKLKGAERVANDKIHSVEKALRKLNPGVEVWTGPILEEAATSRPGVGTPGQVSSRKVFIGLARLELLPKLEGKWAKLAPWAAKVNKLWGLAVREEYRADGGELLCQQVDPLRKASRELQMLAAPQLDRLLGSIHEEVRARVDRLPPELVVAVAEQKTEKEKKKAEKPAGVAQAGNAPAPVPA